MTLRGLAAPYRKPPLPYRGPERSSLRHHPNIAIDLRRPMSICPAMRQASATSCATVAQPFFRQRHDVDQSHNRAR